MNNGRRNGRIRLFLAIIVLVPIVLISILILVNQPQQEEYLLAGSLASDAGMSHGGFEYVAEWDVSLRIKGNSGTLELRLSVGLGDALQRHTYQITQFARDESRISMMIEGRQMVLNWVSNDTIWSHEFDNYYIASWGSYAPPEEIRGTISPTMFTGLQPTTTLNYVNPFKLGKKYSRPNSISSRISDQNPYRLVQTIFFTCHS